MRRYSPAEFDRAAADYDRRVDQEAGLDPGYDPDEPTAVEIVDEPPHRDFISL